MKRIVNFGLLLVGIVLIQQLQLQSATAQTPGKINFYLDAGAGIPAAPSSFTQYWNTGYGGGLGVSYEVQPSIKLQLYGQYYRFGFDKEGARDNVRVPQPVTGVDGADATMFSLMLNLIYEYRLPGNLTSTYVTIGAGYLRAGRSDFTVTTANNTFVIDQKSGSSLGVNGGLGLRHSLSNALSLYVEAKFVTGLFISRHTQYVPVSLGVSF